MLFACQDLGLQVRMSKEQQVDAIRAADRLYGFNDSAGEKSLKSPRTDKKSVGFWFNWAKVLSIFSYPKQLGSCNNEFAADSYF